MFHTTFCLPGFNLLSKFKFVFLLFSCIFFFSASSSAQTNSFKEKSDPEATKILKKLKEVYSKYDALQIDYSLEIENGEDKEVQQGSILQKGDKYRINNNGNIIINNTKTVWMYIKKQNEVQVNDYDSDDDPGFTPAKIFNIDESDKEFFYAITDSDSKGYKIEFKPLDADSDIMKIRIEVDRGQTKITSIKLFQEDGSRMTFLLKKINNAKTDSSSFRFNKEKYPGVKEVDLRD
jgi:outer membrane lipoprotein carrier protein